VAKSSGDVDIFAPQVVSGAGVYNTFEKLLPRETEEKATMLSSVRHGCGGISVYVGLNVSNDELGVVKRRNKWIFSNNELDQSYEEYRNMPVENVGEEDIPLLFLSFPSTKDPTWDERFPGKSTLEIVSLASYEWFEKWKDEKVMHRGEDYENIKQRLGKRMWQQVCRFYPNLKDKVEYFDVGSPLSNQYYIAASRGEFYGADHNVERFSPQSIFNLRADTSIKGLYLTGQDIFVCGFSGGLYGGVISACAILERNLMNDLLALKKQCKKQS
jgi:all-trans-retinol 13,14-reductase